MRIFGNTVVLRILNDEKNVLVRQMTIFFCREAQDKASNRLSLEEFLGVK